MSKFFKRSACNPLRCSCLYHIIYFEFVFALLTNRITPFWPWLPGPSFCLPITLLDTRNFRNQDIVYYNMARYKYCQGLTCEKLILGHDDLAPGFEPDYRHQSSFSSFKTSMVTCEPCHTF